MVLHESHSEIKILFWRMSAIKHTSDTSGILLRSRVNIR